MNRLSLIAVVSGLLIGGPVLAGCVSPPPPPQETVETSPAPAPAPSPPVTEQEMSCADAFRAAASVPLSRTNDAEVRTTMYSCADVDEWWRNAKAFPDAFGATSYADSELSLYVTVACFDAASSPVCQEASLRGLR